MMLTPTQAQFEAVPSLDDLNAMLEPLEMRAGWNKHEPSLWAAPRTQFVPASWSWSLARAALDAAGRLIDTAHADRRNLFMVNPIEGNYYATSRTLVAAYQMILPGERARSHRHSPNALRLILEARDAVYTTVDGVRIDMRPGDVLLTPGWSWHGHGNEGSASGYWIDVLDVPLVHLLEPMFFEPWPQEYQAAVQTTRESPFVFTLENSRAQLDASTTDEHGRKRCVLDAPSLATMTLRMEAVGSSACATLRNTSNQIVCVVSGNGKSRVGGRDITWSAGDVVAVPSWTAYEHTADAEALLFTVSDERMARALGFWREEPAPDRSSS